MPRQVVLDHSDDESSEDESEDESDDESSENGEERYVREEAEEARERVDAEGAAARVVVPVPSDAIKRYEYREDDPAFNAVLSRVRRIEEAVAFTGRAQPTNAVQVIEGPLDEFKLKIHDHSKCPTTQRRFVPGGAANATECAKTRIGHFPHIIQRVAEEEGGGTLFHVVTSSNVLVVAGVHRVHNGDSPVKVSAPVLLERANQVLRFELEDKGEFPLTELRMRMRLVAAHICHTDPGADPIGVGEHGWWQKDISTEVDGQREKSQLLLPSETTGAYTQALLNGRVSWSFKIRSGVTSYACRKHKRCQFKFVVEPESETLRKRCPNLTALSEPFWISAKYNAGKPPKVEAWVEAEVEGGAPVKYDLSRKRPRDEPAAGANGA
jgi:hypothetical protein